MDDNKCNYSNALIERLNNKSATIGIIGLGYVGLPLALRYAQVGYRVIGFDIDQSKVDKLLTGQSYIEHISATHIQHAVASYFLPTSDFSQICEVDSVILCVPTPLNKYREPDLTYVINTVVTCLPFLRAGQIISLESTTYPGTTEEEIQTRLASRGLQVGENVFLVFSPEREDPANPDYTTASIPKVCGGATPTCLQVGQALYGQVIERIVPVSSLKTAEMTKLLENIHRAVNIGLMNEMKIVADKMGIDIHEVIAAAATKPFGFVPYYPGPGLGGHCIPIDPFYLTWKAREYGLHTRFIELAGEINNSMPEWVVNKLTEALNEKSQSVKNSKLLILGIAYKKNVDDMRESPALEIIRLLAEKGAKLAYSDPHVPVFPLLREGVFNIEHVSLTPQTLARYDCALLITDHAKFDYALIREHSALIIDTRGVYKDKWPNVVKA